MALFVKCVQSMMIGLYIFLLMSLPTTTFFVVGRRLNSLDFRGIGGDSSKSKKEVRS